MYNEHEINPSFMPKYLEFSAMTDEQVLKVLKDNKIGLTVEEARKIESILGRAPTMTEAVVWGIQGSEHCSYKSSRRFLSELPTDGPNVILGPKEDAGIVEICRDGDDRWGLVMSHESHNHPSQIVPFEGAATGIGGNVRDVACMGAKVIAVLDPLRFGNPENNEARVIANGVVSGIAGYGNPIGVPNVGGDVNFGEAFNENCLVNVLTLGLVKESEIIHSYAPAEAAEVGYDIILIGKPTDNSGMGGAAFASLELDEEDKESNKGAVQEPNPFLKRHLLASTYDLFARLKSMNKLDKVGFKDMGAGGNVCSTVEQAADQGFGVEIDLEKIHVGMDNLPASVIAASETQERFAWTCHPELTEMIVEHYNQKWELGKVAHNAKASLVGKITPGGQYILNYKGERVIDAKCKDIVEGIQYKRPTRPKNYDYLTEPEIDESSLDLNDLFLKLMGAKNICSRRPIYNKYDKDVQGNTVIEAGEADAGLITPLLEMEGVSPKAQKTGVAVATDGVSRYSKISPYWQGANAVAEAMRNVACVGARPIAITDCLNYNNPEDPELLWEFEQGVKGISDACRGIELKSHVGHATPVISGNVSLYNAVDATATIGCAGVIEDYKKAIVPQLKTPGNSLFLIGERRDELGASEFYHLLGHLGKNVPTVDFKQAQKEMYAVIDGVDQGVIVSAHDISEGGLGVALAEMTMPHPRHPFGNVGMKVDLDSIDGDLNPYQNLFSETGGFVVEISESHQEAFQLICKNYGVQPMHLGHVTDGDRFQVKAQGQTLIDHSLAELQEVYFESLAGYLK